MDFGRGQEIKLTACTYLAIERDGLEVASFTAHAQRAPAERVSRAAPLEEVTASPICPPAPCDMAS